ncbi:PRC-barrel domain-containing protein [Sulfitobacter aestuarii]|uniref:PRC-barrel domain-containing protein n=1 Tax=Sulfitobacter aestuarii TaxID=2161676 RepID=A0ABW5U0A1_9RHOB
MKTRNAIAALTALPLLALPASLMAQTSTETLETDDAVVDTQPVTGAQDYIQLDDAAVIGSTGEKIGEIEDLLADATGKPVAVVVETEGFIGIGDKDVIVTFDQLEMLDGQFHVNMTEDELEALPKWDD